MKPWPSRGKARFTTAVVLCVWLLALGTGIAHACLCAPASAHVGESDHPPHPAQAAQPLAATERMSPCQAFDHPCMQSAWPSRPLFGSARQTGPTQQKSPKPPQTTGPLRAAGIRWHAPDRVERVPASDGSAWVERPTAIRFLRLLI